LELIQIEDPGLAMGTDARLPVGLVNVALCLESESPSPGSRSGAQQRSRSRSALCTRRGALDTAHGLSRGSSPNTQLSRAFRTRGTRRLPSPPAASQDYRLALPLRGVEELLPVHRPRIREQSSGARFMQTRQERCPLILVNTPISCSFSRVSRSLSRYTGQGSSGFERSRGINPSNSFRSPCSLAGS